MTDEAITRSCDVLVVGGGIAGAFAAIRARDAGAGRVIQVDKGWAGKSGMSGFAAGKLYTVLFPGEDVDARISEAARSAEYLYMQDRVRSHFENVWEIVHYEKYGMSKYRSHQEIQESIRNLRELSKPAYPSK